MKLIPSHNHSVSFESTKNQSPRSRLLREHRSDDSCDCDRVFGRAIKIWTIFSYERNSSSGKSLTTMLLDLGNVAQLTTASTMMSGTTSASVRSLYFQ